MLVLGRKTLISDDVVLIRKSIMPEDPQRRWIYTEIYTICLSEKGMLGYRKAGLCDLRFGYNTLLYYGGNIGYRVNKKYRGHHLAQKACRLLFEEARKAGMPYLIITCNPDNLPSRRTCEHLGGKLLETVDLPEDNDMYQMGDRQKCIFYYPLNDGEETPLYADTQKERIVTFTPSP